METVESPPAIIVVAQTGVGSAFSAGAPIEEPPPKTDPRAKPKPPANAPAAAPAKPEAASEPAENEPAAAEDDDEWGEAEGDDAVAEEPAVRPVAPPALRWPTYAVTDYRPRGTVERDLCDRAANGDYVYAASMAALTAGAIFFDSKVAKHWETPFARLSGAGMVGLTWGAFLGGGYLSLPKCSPDFVPPVAPEGVVAKRWPLALAIATAAAVSAPFMVFIETGPVPVEWAVSERATRIFVPAATGFVGALLPWIPAIAPRTYRNALKLERLRMQGAPIPPGASTAPSGFMLGYGGTF